MNERAVSLPTASFDYLVVLARHALGVVDFQTLVAELTFTLGPSFEIERARRAAVLG